MEPLSALPDFVKSIVDKEWWEPLLRTGQLAISPKNTYLVRVGERDEYTRYGLEGWAALQRAGVILALVSTQSLQTNALHDELLATADLYTLTEARFAMFKREILREALMKSDRKGLMTLLAFSARNIDMLCSFSVCKLGCPPDVALAALLWMLSISDAGGDSRKIPKSLPRSILPKVLGLAREEVVKQAKVLRNTGYLYSRDGEEFIDKMTPMLISQYGF